MPFNSHDLARHVQLYTADALLFGSDDELYRGHAGVRSYFAKLSDNAGVRNYAAPVAVTLDPDLVVTAAYVDFFEGDTLMPYRLTWTLIRREGNWKIAQHHGSPRPEGDG
jgi:ketosteroid isomerase-like protein